MTDFASLVLAVDSTQVPKGAEALDRLATSGARAEQVVNRVTASAGAQRAGMQQLSFQIGDVAQQFALGTNPMIIFAQQGQQVVQALTMMRGSASGFIGFMGGPWGAVIMGAVTVVGMLGAKLLDTSAAAKQAEFSSYALADAQKILGSVFDMTTGKINTQSSALLALANAKILVARVESQARQREALTTMSNFGQPTISSRLGAMGRMFGGITTGNLGQEILLNQQIRNSGAGAQAVMAGAMTGEVAADEAIRRLDNLRKAGRLTAEQFEAGAKAIANYNVETQNLNVLNQSAESLASGKLNPALAQTAASHNRASRAVGSHGAAHAAATPKISEAQRALEAQTKATDAYIASLQKEVAAIGKTPKELRLAEVARQKEAAATKAAADEIQKWSDKRENALAKQANADWEKNVLGPLKREYELLGLTGEARERAALALEKDAFYAERAGQSLDEVNSQWEQYYNWKLRNIEKESALQKDIEAAAILQEQVDALIGSFGSLRGVVGGGIGNLIGALTSGNPTAGLLGMGGLGTAAGLMLGGGAAYDKLLGVSQTGLGKLGIGGGVGSFLSKGLVGAGLGSMFGSITGSGTGGGIGGAAASLAGLGPIGVIAGGLLGGLIGSLFGGDPDQAVASLNMANGKAGFGNLGQWGKNKDQYGQEVSGAAGSVAEAINSIVSSLGGSVTSSLGNISIGKFKGQWAVNDGSKPGFRGLAAGDPGATVYGSAEEAIRAAIQMAIKTSTEGLSDQVKTLLTKPGADIEAQLGKAQAFQAIVKQAAEATHPLGEALKALQGQFDELRAVFNEASATTEQLAQLTKLETDQRKALIGAFTQYISENFTTDAEKLAKASADATAEMQRLGFAGVTTKAQFKALTDGIDVTTDAGVTLLESLVKIAPQFLMVADAAEQAAAAEVQRQAQLTAQRQDLQIQLLDAMGNKTLALAMQRQRELAAMDESLRPLQELIWATQDHAAAVADARNVLAQAYQRERSELQQTADKMRGLADSLRSFRASIYESADGVSRNAALSRLMIVGAQAAAGNEGAARDLPSVTNRFLDASRSNASTLTQFKRDQALAANYVDKAIAGIDAQASAAQQQIAALDKQVEGLIELNKNVVTVDQAVKDLSVLMEAPAAVTGNARLLETQEEQVDLIDRLIGEVERLNRDTTTLQVNMNERLARIDRFITRGETDGFKVTNDSDTPLYTSAV